MSLGSFSHHAIGIHFLNQSCDEIWNQKRDRVGLVKSKWIQQAIYDQSMLVEALLLTLSIILAVMSGGVFRCNLHECIFPYCWIAASVVTILEPFISAFISMTVLRPVDKYCQMEKNCQQEKLIWIQAVKYSPTFFTGIILYPVQWVCACWLFGATLQPDH